MIFRWKTIKKIERKVLDKVERQFIKFFFTSGFFQVKVIWFMFKIFFFTMCIFLYFEAGELKWHGKILLFLGNMLVSFYNCVTGDVQPSH